MIVFTVKRHRVIPLFCCLALAGLIALGAEVSPKVDGLEIESQLKQASDAVRNARNPADLDGTVATLRQLRNRATTSPVAPEMVKADSKLDAAARFVTRWQVYLAKARAGDLDSAKDILEDLSSTDEIGLIPRSEILARLHRPVPAQAQASIRPALMELLDGLRTLDEISPALDKLNTWSSEGLGPRSELQFAITGLTLLDRTYREFKAGLSTNLDVFLTEARLCPNYLMPLRAQLIALVLPRYLGLPEETKPKPGESLHGFLDRVVTDAIAKREYVLAIHARQFEYSMKYGPREMQASQAAAFIAAQNQEGAQQYAQAVASYQKTLAIGTDVVPPKAVGDRLTAIQKEHPAEYQEGLQQFLAPQPRTFDPRRLPSGVGLRPPALPSPPLHPPK